MSSCIIGANYGDEGKGLITDFETRRIHANLVVRFNGGAQAGHTVTTDKAKHIFGHVGAGALAGADTWLGSKFIVNPFVLKRELQVLKDLGVSASVMSAPNAMVSTVYDMALNSLVELSRGDARHGSCGLGINETVTRHSQGAKYQITCATIAQSSLTELKKTLNFIRTDWAPKRLLALGISELEIQEPYKSLFLNDDLSAMAKAMKELSDIIQDQEIYNVRTVFEGAQGLALDEHLGEFPHVTRSLTGLPNAIGDAFTLGIKKLQPIYVTRAYLTRHGAGPLEHEGVPLDAAIVDNTNVHNEWQGTIRYAPLNLKQLAKYIEADLARAGFIAQVYGVQLTAPTIALTCIDQMSDRTAFIDLDGTLSSCRTNELPALVGKRLRYKISHIGHGPTANDVEFLNFSL